MAAGPPAAPTDSVFIVRGTKEEQIPMTEITENDLRDSQNYLIYHASEQLETRVLCIVSTRQAGREYHHLVTKIMLRRKQNKCR